ncbi:hypothetical protein JCM17380_24980 [Desulfosporosinus burensis]
MLPIDIKHIRYNFSTTGIKKTYIVVHDTGNTGRGADDISHYKYFDGAVRNASAHYFVDKDSITETVDPTKNSWHCGDGGGKYSITNANSIGVEICINSDGNYEMAVSNAVDLVKHLMKRFGIDLAHVVRHYDASRKNCPATMSANNWAKWDEFKKRVGGQTTVANTIGTAVITANIGLNMRQEPNTSATVLVSVPNGTTCPVLAQTNGWYQISYSGNTGWVSAQYVDFTPTPIPAPQVVEKIVEKIVEVPVEKIVEKVVEKTVEVVKKLKYLVVYNNPIDKRGAERLAEFLQCPTLDASQVTAFDYSFVETPIGVGGGTFNPAVKTVVKGYDRDDTTLEVLKYIGKIQ